MLILTKNIVKIECHFSFDNILNNYQAIKKKIKEKWTMFVFYPIINLTDSLWCFSIMENTQSNLVYNPHIFLLHALKNLTFQFTPVTHMVYLEIRLHYLDFAIEKLTSSNWISKYTMCVTGVNWKVKFLSACIVKISFGSCLESFSFQPLYFFKIQNEFSRKIFQKLLRRIKS